MLVLDTDHLSVLEWEASTTTQRLLERLSLIALLSRNLTDFRKIPDLKVEDWTAE